jgi:hypothetical protein
MDPLTLTIIITIIALIIVLELYKRQNEKVTSNLHADNLKQMLTLAALEYKFNTGMSATDENQSDADEITGLINRYERGEIQAESFRRQMDNLLNKRN